MKTKKCSKCLHYLPITNFHRNGKYLRSHCMKCCSLKDKERYKLNREKFISRRMERYEKHKPLEKFKMSEYRRQRKRISLPKTEEQKKRSRAQYKKSRDSHRDRYRARKLHNYHVNKGNIKHYPCCICGNKKTEAHHCDYSKPLEVMWLCKAHHVAWHRVFKIG